MPERLRVDNGIPWGSKGDLPTDLELWLAGLGVAVQANPPCSPQDNGVVERSNGTGKRWAEPSKARSASDLQRTIDRMDQIQRDRYPHLDGKSRMEVYPRLAHSGRAYDQDWESQNWDLHRAHDLLAGFVVPREINRAGTLSVYNRNYYVGKAHANAVAFVSFDPQQQQWLFHDPHNHLLNHRPAPEVSASNILALTVTCRRERVHK
jgi:hypothetical protein